MNEQFESSLQNLVYQVDAGTGRRMIQVILFALFAFAMGALYTFSNFQGLKNERAMDCAQLARQQVAEGHLMTQCVRPLSLGRMLEMDPEAENPVLNHPDLFQPPVWPVTLSLLYRMVGIPEGGAADAAFVWGWDYLPVTLNHLFTALSAIWVWLIARKLFDRRVGALSAGAFVISDLVWKQSLLGADLAQSTFFVLGAVYAALWAGELPPNREDPQDEGSVWRWLLPLTASSLLTALAFLTRYAAGTVAVLIFLYLGTSRRTRSWSKALLFLGLATLPVIPWVVRNVSLCGSPFGLVFWQMLTDTYLFPGDALMRSMNPELADPGAVFYAVQIKMMTNLRAFTASGFGMGGAGLLLALFAAMYFHRFMRPSSRRLRWCILPAAFLLILAASAWGEESLRGLTMYWPLMIPYGWAFFMVLLDRLQFEIRFLDSLAVAAVLFLTGLPLLLNVFPPRTGLPYPPYYHRYITWVGAMAEPEECIVTDMPWATAWYGNAHSILLPRDIEGFYEIHENIQPVSIAYFTTLTRDKPWVRGLADPGAPEFTWYQVFAAGKVPSTFPLTYGRFIAGSDQLVLADRQRW